jgi:hypothetical protein
MWILLVGLVLVPATKIVWADVSTVVRAVLMALLWLVVLVGLWMCWKLWRLHRELHR